MNVISFLLLPILTGLGATFWVRLANGSPWHATLAYGLSQLWVTGVLLAMSGDTHKTPISIIDVTVVIVCYGIVTLAWVYVSSHGAYFAGAFTEISYPLFSALFMWLLFNGLRLNGWQIAGGCVIALGVMCVIYGETTTTEDDNPHHFIVTSPRVEKPT